MAASQSLQASFGASSVSASGIANGDKPVAPAALTLSGPGQVTLQWTLVPTATAPLSATASSLTGVGGLQAYSNVATDGNIVGQAQVTVIESTSFVLTSFVPGSANATMVAQIDVSAPSPRANLLPTGVIAAWTTANTSTSGTMPTGWARCTGSNTAIANLEGRFPMGCSASSASRNQPGGGMHSHGLSTFSQTGTSSSNGLHNHILAGFTSRESSSRSGAITNTTHGSFVYRSDSAFSETGAHTHPVHANASPQTASHKTSTTASDPAASPLPPYYVVRFGQKITTPTS